MVSKAAWLIWKTQNGRVLGGTNPGKNLGKTYLKALKGRMNQDLVKTNGAFGKKTWTRSNFNKIWGNVEHYLNEKMMRESTNHSTEHWREVLDYRKAVPQMHNARLCNPVFQICA